MRLGVTIALLLLAAPALATGGRCPNLLIVLDASDSMNQPPGAGITQSKISIAKQVLGELLLGDPDAGVPAPNPGLRFGFTSFPGPTSCSAGPTMPLPQECGYGTNAATAAAINAVTLHNSTPTAKTLVAVAHTPDMEDASRPRYVLVLTDGQPTCSDDGGQSVGAVELLRDGGAETFVVGFGDVTADTKAVNTLNAMAAAGQPPLPDGGPARFYPATDDLTLAAALSDILSHASGEFGTSQSCDPCADLTCGTGQRCVAGATGPSCISDPCSGASCPAGDFCRPNDGGPECLPTCTTACPSGEACVDGQCSPDPCALGSCRTCPSGQAATPDGGCATNLCPDITCPGSAPECAYNTCFSLASPAVDGGTSPADGGGSGSSVPQGHPPVGGTVTSGCNCSSGAGPSLLLLVALGGRAVTRRRRSS
jgi:MYXO-CTERM domain-containing protein